MDISAIQRHVQATDLPLEKLATSTEVSDQDKVSEVSRQFEALLLRQILSQANKPLFKSTLLETDNSTNAIYHDLITEQMADRISRGGSFGFANVLNHQLAAQIIKKDEAGAVSTREAAAKPSSAPALHRQPTQSGRPKAAPISDSRMLVATPKPILQTQDTRKKTQPIPGKRL